MGSSGHRDQEPATADSIVVILPVKDSTSRPVNPITCNTDRGHRVWGHSVLCGRFRRSRAASLLPASRGDQSARHRRGGKPSGRGSGICTDLFLQPSPDAGRLGVSAGPVAPASPVPAPDFAPFGSLRPILSQHVCTNVRAFKPQRSTARGAITPDRSQAGLEGKPPSPGLTRISHRPNGTGYVEHRFPRRDAPLRKTQRTLPRPLRGNRASKTTPHLTAVLVGVGPEEGATTNKPDVPRPLGRLQAGVASLSELFDLASAILRMAPVIRFEASSERKARIASKTHVATKSVDPPPGRAASTPGSGNRKSRRTKRLGNFLDRADGHGFGRQRVFSRD
jgi:hypothetical protein